MSRGGRRGLLPSMLTGMEGTTERNEENITAMEVEEREGTGGSPGSEARGDGSPSIAEGGANDANATPSTTGASNPGTIGNSNGRKADVDLSKLYGSKRWRHPSDPNITLQNVTGSCKMADALDLRKISTSARNVEYNPRRFSAAVMRIQKPKATALLFSSGKVVITGAKGVKECMKAAGFFRKILKRIGEEVVETPEVKLQNMVATCDVRFPIRLEGLAYTHARLASYEPEMFPGLIYRMVEPKAVLLIFVSGKVVVTGAKSLVTIHNAYDLIYDTLVNFKKTVILPVASSTSRKRSLRSDANGDNGGGGASSGSNKRQKKN